MEKNLFPSIMKNAPIGYAFHKILCDEKGVPIDYIFLEINETFEKYTGLKAEKLIGKKITETLPKIKDDDFDWIKFYGNIALNNKTEEIEQFSLPLNKWFMLKAYSPEKYYFVVLIYDFEREDETQKLAKIGRWEHNLTTNHLYWSKNFYDILELDYKNLSPTYDYFFEMVHPEDREMVNSSYQESLKNKSKFEIEHRLLLKNGKIKWVKEICHFRFDEKGNLIRTVGIMQEITEMKNYEEKITRKNLELLNLNENLEATNEELKATNEELESNYATLEDLSSELKGANEAKSSFLAKVSHELRTPMNGILTGSELAMKTENAEEILEYIKIINKSATRLMPIINNILDVSIIEKNKLELFEEQIELNSYLLSIIHPLEIQAKNKGIKLKFIREIPDDFWVKADKTKFSQVIINIVDNAIKFTENGKVQVKVFHEIKEEKVNLLFEVKDTGIGVKNEFAEKIFTPFEQEEKYMTRRYGGAGLGLAIAKEIVEKMNGNISFKSEFGKGTTFYFNFLLEKAAGFAEFYNLDNVIEEYKFKILAAEDDELGKLLLKKIFEKESVYFEIAENGKKALDLYSKKDFDLIFMDIQMPEMDGITAALKIREIEKNTDNHIPIIALTGHAFEKDKEEALSAGMDDFISKPFKIDELLETIKKFCKRN